ncbi:MAG: hypothetical protein KDA87_23910 [Planctomycetales bacterium]|nr:hypothetical protein [Planctomycetales bacterium]
MNWFPFGIRQSWWFRIILGLCISVVLSQVASTQEANVPDEDDYYKITELPIPDAAYLEVGALELLPGPKLAVSSRRGEIYLVSQPFGRPQDIRYQKYASGLHEVLGLSFHEGHLYATQRGEVTRLVDQDEDGRADVFETVSDGWGINGDYHEYAFGSKFDSQGQMWVVLCLTGSGAAADDSPFRGWCMRVSADGSCQPTCSGIRSPGGIGMNLAGDVFYTDNQGPWNGTCGLKWLRPGSFQGNPTGNKYYDLTDAIGDRPTEPESNTRIMQQAKQIPELEPTAVMFPYQKMGQSASGIACDTSQGKFGPFAGQLFVSDQTHSTVMRVFLEKIDGHYQGVCFPFREGFGSGNVAMVMSESGSLFVGGTNRGWGSRGRAPYALERLDWTGKVPFEVKEMRAKSDGFELEFTKAVDPQAAADKNSYSMETYTYIYQSSYGSPEVDHSKPQITEVVVSDDLKSVRIKLSELKEGHVHELHLDGVRSGANEPLVHPVGYYTLNYIPK